MTKVLIVILIGIAAVALVATDFDMEDDFRWGNEAVVYRPMVDIEEVKEELEKFEKIEKRVRYKLIDVPFLAQAPKGEWKNPRFQDGCEETSLIMAWHWIQGDDVVLTDVARKEILDMSLWQEEKHGNYIDTSATSTAQLFMDYYDYNKVRSIEIGGVEDILRELVEDRLVIVPVDGQVVGNKYYTPPGPERHMIVVTGFDDETKEFITNDPGTRRGGGYRYGYVDFLNSIRDYPTGDHVPIVDEKSVGVVISKQTKNHDE